MALLRSVQLRPAQARFLLDRGHLFYSALSCKADLSKMEQFALKVMNYGGVVFIVPECESDMDSLMARGEVFDCGNPPLVKGQPGRCHANAARYWSHHEDKVQIVTGYGLSSDGIWLQHTWCRKIRGGRLVETTEPRVLHFGVRLNQEESAAFFIPQV